VISLSPRPTLRTWRTISFPSTLHLTPVLDLLLATVPPRWEPDLRLGLQEALVNAAKHGNQLDPSKVVYIRFSRINHQWWWIIGDQGGGFSPPTCHTPLPDPFALPLAPVAETRDCGRGLFLIDQIFDQVYWNPAGNELTLCKDLPRSLPHTLLPFWFKAA